MNQKHFHKQAIKNIMYPSKIANHLVKELQKRIDKSLELLEQSNYKNADKFSPIHIDLAIETLKGKVEQE